MTALPFGNQPESTHKHTQVEMLSDLICLCRCHTLDSECADECLWTFYRSINTEVHNDETRNLHSSSSSQNVTD
jgi:hypothetical protein